MTISPDPVPESLADPAQPPVVPTVTVVVGNDGDPIQPAAQGEPVVVVPEDVTDPGNPPDAAVAAAPAPATVADTPPAATGV